MASDPPIDAERLKELTGAVDRAQAELDKHVKFRLGVSPVVPPRRNPVRF
jgi:hypothetical protein